jgi:hypothetical protein
MVRPRLHARRQARPVLLLPREGRTRILAARIAEAARRHLLRTSLRQRRRRRRRRHGRARGAEDQPAGVGILVLRHVALRTA